MKRTMAIVAMVMILAGTGVWAQDAQEETPQFVRTMLRLMAESGWTNSELAEIRQSCEAYQWEGLEDVDPQLLMRALQYAHMTREQAGLEATDQAALAHELALQAKEMNRLGYDEREIARVAASSTREVLADAGGGGTGDTGAGERLRARLQAATQDGYRDLDRDRLRDSDPSGPAARVGEESVPGVPPSPPGDRPDGVPNDPPGDGPGSGGSGN